MIDPPVIYYVNPLTYVHVDLTKLSRQAYEIELKFKQLMKQTRYKPLGLFIRQVSKLAQASQKGMSSGTPHSDYVK